MKKGAAARKIRANPFRGIVYGTITSKLKARSFSKKTIKKR